MKSKYRNLFLIIGVIAIVIMLFTFDLSYTELWQNIKSAGWWFFAVIMIWIPIYILNALSWNVIINDGKQSTIPFLRILKYTISGYALNYVTPIGVLGGEPYRIMEITPYVGGEKATSSVILYAMMHIFSHFIFWAFSIFLYLILYFNPLNHAINVFLLSCLAFCALGIYLFMRGYRKGLARRTLKMLCYIPGLKKRAQILYDKYKEQAEKIDQNIAELHHKRKSTFYFSLGMEFFARILGCLEILFIFMILTDSISFWDCILIQAFTSLFANLFFFMPMELGAREGGFALAVGGLALSGAFGVLAGLLTRLREVFWIVVGVLIMKFGNKKR